MLLFQGQKCCCNWLFKASVSALHSFTNKSMRCIMLMTWVLYLAFFLVDLLVIKSVVLLFPYVSSCPLLTVCPVSRLHGPDREPCVEHGPSSQGRAGWDPWPVHLLHEKQRDQTQPCATPIHTPRTHPSHTNLSPAPFIEDWRETACISPMESWVLSSSCEWIGLKQEVIIGSWQWCLCWILPVTIGETVAFLFVVIYLFCLFLGRSIRDGKTAFLCQDLVMDRLFIKMGQWLFHVLFESKWVKRSRCGWNLCLSVVV